MNLGLLDILTAQQVDAPSFKDAPVKAFDSARPVSEKKFKDYVEEPKAKVEAEAKSALPDNDKAKDAAEASYNEAVNEYSKENVSGQVNSLSSFFIPLQEENIATNVINHEIANNQNIGLVDLIKSLQIIKDSGVVIPEGSPLQALLNLKDSINGSVQQLNITEGVSGQTIGQLVAKIANGDLQLGDFDVESIGGLQESLEILQQLAGQVIANDAVNVVTGNQDGFAKVGEFAGSLINDAKEVAQSVNVNNSDLKSAQIADLLKGVKDISSDKQQNSDAKESAASNVINNVLNKASEIGLRAESALLNKQIIKQDIARAENGEVLNNKINNAVNQAQNNSGSQLQSSLNNNSGGGSEQFTKTPDAFANASIQNDVEISTGQDFVKLQKYVDLVGKSLGAEKNTKATAENVMAQIKFGVSSSAKGANNITIQLHPKELGSVDVRMEVGNDGRTRVAIIAEKTETLNLLQKDATSLKMMLQDALKTDSSQLSFSFHQNDGQEKWKDFFSQNNLYSGNESSRDGDLEVNTASSYQYQSNLTAIDGLDIRV